MKLNESGPFPGPGADFGKAGLVCDTFFSMGCGIVRLNSFTCASRDQNQSAEQALQRNVGFNDWMLAVI